MSAHSASTARHAHPAVTLALLVACGVCRAQPPAPTTPPQVPLCMIGDSITWAGEGDYWRQYLLERLPRLAFVGTHTAVLGYSHAGEGGNSTGRVLARMDAIPDCPYYHLLIGTNDNSIKDPAVVETHAQGTASRIEQIVAGLLAKPSVEFVFLGSVLPCQTDNPLRDQTNAATNRYLRAKLAAEGFDRRVIWVEYEGPIRATENWGPMILLHPTKDGYRLIAGILADYVTRTLAIDDAAAVPQHAEGTGVRVVNLWDERKRASAAPVIAGWYVLSFDVGEVVGPDAEARLHCADPEAKSQFDQSFPIPVDSAGKRLQFAFFTEYEGYGYTRCVLSMETNGCDVSRVLLEKRRPSGQASVYGAGEYVDTRTQPLPGELVEFAGR